MILKKLDDYIEQKTSGRKKQRIVGAALLLLGITLAQITIAYQIEYTVPEIVFYCALGIAVSIFGLVRFLIPGMSRKRHEMDYDDKYVIDVTTPKDTNDLERSLTKFRSDLADFFAAAGGRENPPLQSDTTQFYKNTADIRHKRLDHLGIRMEMRSERRAYSKQPVKSSRYFDGKYEIGEIDEEIEARRRFSKDGKTIFVKRDSQAAHYTIINAKKSDSGLFICPNCGKETTREKLIDGCDYCGTKFRVEDLGEKIAGFSLRDNYETAYAKYKENRAEYAGYAFVIMFIAVYLFWGFCMTVGMFDEATSGVGSGDPVSPLLLLLGFAGFAGSLGFLVSLVGMIPYLLLIFPLMEVSASHRYHNRKNLAAVRRSEQEDKVVEEKIRQEDPLFSVSGFYSDIQSKIASILFSDTEKQIDAFAETDLRSFLGRYGKVLDYDTEDLTIDDYRIENGEQIADVTADLNLLELNGGKAVEHREKMRVRFVKSAACRTKAVCEPYVLTCRSCGASLDIADGLTCRYCGTRPDLKQYDWTIRSVSGDGSF